MGLLRVILGAESACLVAALCAACVWKTLRHGRGLAGLVGHRDGAMRWTFDPLRCQMTLITVGIALSYLFQSPQGAGKPALPAVPYPVLALLALSYAAGLRSELRRLKRRHEEMR